MKKILSIMLSLSMLLSLTACGNNNSISVATGGTTGTYYGFTSVISQVMNANHSDVLNLKVESTGASKANIQLVNSNDAKIAIVQNDVMTYAYNGEDMFEGNPITSFSAIASCYPEAIQIIANKSINSISDLRGKRVSVGDAGSGVEFNAKQILAAYGMDIEKDIQKNNQSFGDSCDSLKNNNLDAAFVVAGTPTPAVSELATNFDFNILSIDQNHIDQLKNQYGFYTSYTIPKDTYSALSSDVKTVAVMATFIARNDLSEDVVYTFTKALFEESDQYQHAKAELLNKETGISGIAIPLHKGAEKYYREIGILQ